MATGFYHFARTTKWRPSSCGFANLKKYVLLNYHFISTLYFVCVCPQDLTGLESMDQCRRTLEQHNWNIEVKPLEFISFLRLICLKYSHPMDCASSRLLYRTHLTSRKECPVCLTLHHPGLCRSIQQTIEFIVT